MKRFRLLPLALALGWIASPAATYYVDQTAGSDSNPGTELAPWQNCPGTYQDGTDKHTGGHVLAAGDVVYFDRADTWDVSNTASQTGGGLLPVGGASYLGDTWNPSGQTARTRATLRCIGPIEAGIVRFKEDHPTLPTVVQGFDGDGNNQPASGCDLNRRFAQGPLTGALKVIRNCYFHDLQGSQADGIFNYGIVARGRVDSGTDHNVANVLVENCEVYRSARDCILAYPDNSPGAYVANMTVRGCHVHGLKNDVAYNEGSGIVAKADVRNMIIEFNVVGDVNSAGIFVFGEASGAPTGLIIRHNIVRPANNPGGRGCIRVFETGTKSVDIYGNVVLAPSGQPGAGIDFTSCTGPLTARIYNNTVFGTHIEMAGVGAGNAVEVKNNLVIGHGGIINAAGCTLENNVSAASYAGFRNPTDLPTAFVPVPGRGLATDRDGLQVIAGPAVGAGVPLDAAFRSSINGVAREEDWNIGAYQ